MFPILAVHSLRDVLNLEALNSLCELSGRLVVTTKRAEKSIGHQLNFDRQGNLTSQRLTARSTGTTVCIERLFEALPVRRGEFIRSIKKHYQKLLRCLESYAIISVGVKLCVFNTQKVCNTLMQINEPSKAFKYGLWIRVPSN